MKELLPVEIWVDNLSFLSFYRVFKIAFKNRGASIRFLGIKSFAYKLVKLIEMLNIMPVKVEKVTYSLGDMKLGERSVAMALRFEMIEIIDKILENLKRKEIYKEIIKFVPEEKSEEYFAEKIRLEIYGAVRLLFIVFWHQGHKNSNKNNVLLCRYSPLLKEVESVWSYSAIKIESYNKIGYYKSLIKDKIRIFLKEYFFFTSIKMSDNAKLTSKYNIAITYAEGFDLNKRSDISWYPKSKIDKERIFVLFSNNTVSEKELEKINIRWICLPTAPLLKLTNINNLWRNAVRFFRDRASWETLKLNIKSETSLEIWIRNNGGLLFSYIKLWVKLFKYFNIKIVFTMGHGSGDFLQNISQSIALDFLGGVRIGTQRSVVLTKKDTNYLRRNTNDIFFVWGQEAAGYSGLSKVFRNLIVTGYPYERIFNLSPLAEILQYKQNNGKKKFIISLFDDAYSNDIWLTKNTVGLFYKKFLEWLIEDETIVIVTKEKDSKLFNQLEIDNIVSRANRTNRFVRLDNVCGRFPSEASIGVDMAVGIAPSTPIAESVIAGYKGVHCDIAKHPFQQYYEWGYEKVIFDDIDRLIAALKRYKENPHSEPELGDWSSYIDRLDPFRDGRGGERMGTYMRWLLENFDQGKNRDEAIEYANEMYKRQWGKDKVYNAAELTAGDSGESRMTFFR